MGGCVRCWRGNGQINRRFAALACCVCLFDVVWCGFGGGLAACLGFKFFFDAAKWVKWGVVGLGK